MRSVDNDCNMRGDRYIPDKIVFEENQNEKYERENDSTKSPLLKILQKLKGDKK